MKLQQLRYIREIQRNQYNISLTAETLFTSQPGISKQVGLLEEELGVQIFERSGKHLSGSTEIGGEIIREACQMLDIEDKIKSISMELTSPDKGRLNILTTNAIAKFLLPDSVSYFIKRYPKVSLHMGTIEPGSTNSTLIAGPHDLFLVAQDIEENSELRVLPAYKWSLSLVVASDHPLATEENITLAQIAKEKLISYEPKSTGRMAIDNAFEGEGLTPEYIITAMNVEVIKEYARQGVGVGIVASVAKDTTDDSIVFRSLEGLIPDCYAWFCYNKNTYLKRYVYDFIEKFAPHLTRTVIEETANMSKAELVEKFKDLVTYK
jgi:LysR family transcriptional regulator, cys regulon transcriptional activator